jgi:MMP 1-O-methyltransferase
MREAPAVRFRGVKRLSSTFLHRRGRTGRAAEGWPEDLRDVPTIKGWLAHDAALLLYRLARAVRRGCIVEVGSYRGRSTVVLARGAAAGGNAPIYAVEPHEHFVGALGGEFGPEDRAAFYRNMVRTGAYRQVRLLNVSSEILAPGWTEPVALLWLDGDHSYEGVSRDFHAWERHLLPACDVVLDDADDPALGPYRLVEELIGLGWVDAGRFGRVAHLTRKSPG